MQIIRRVLFCFCFLFPLSTFAWNALGHMVVATIAYEQLKPNVREQVDSMVTEFNKEYPNVKNFQQIVNWPDNIRGQKIETYTHWHYIDMAFSDDGSPLKNLTDTDNAVWALKNIIPIIKNTRANPYERVRFLAFFAHIISDLHQPLHTVSRISAQHLDGDKGGNLFMVRYGTENSKLHHLWDGGVGLFESAATEENAKTIATSVTQLYPITSLTKEMNDLDPDNWVKEGMHNATTFVYATPEGQQVSTSYVTTGKRVAAQEAALAGYRLGNYLNQLLG